MMKRTVVTRYDKTTIFLQCIQFGNAIKKGFLRKFWDDFVCCIFLLIEIFYVTDGHGHHSKIFSYSIYYHFLHHLVIRIDLLTK